MTPQWSRELWRIGLSLWGALLLGLLIEQVLLLITIVLGLFLLLHLHALYRLDAWLRHSKSYNPPNVGGVWGEVYYLFYRSQQRQRKRKKTLAKYLKRFQRMTKAMPDATVVLDEDNQIEWFNEAAQQQLALRHPRDLMQRIDNLIRNPLFTEFLRSNQFSESLEIPAPHNDSRLLSVSIIPYTEGRRVLVARDITQLQRLQEARRDFVANVSHELRTPLTVINGYLEAMHDVPESDPLKQSWGYPIKVMNEQSLRMTAIVEDLLMLSRLETGRREIYKEAIDIPSMVKIVAEEARHSTGDKQHNIVTDVDQSLWFCGNQAQLFSVFSNLVFNAVRYTPAGGDINLRWYQEKDKACFEVVDRGVGIAPQHVPRLTERFYRVDEGRAADTGGTGLGLAIVKHILENHDGRLTIESQVNKGSTFRCCFPQQAASASPRIGSGKAMS